MIMARMIGGGGSSSALRLLRRPTLEQPPRPDHAWGVMPLCRLSSWSVKPVLLPPASLPLQQLLQTRVFCNYMDYIPGNSSQPKNSATKKKLWGWQSRSRGQECTNNNNARELLDAAMLPIRGEDLPGLDDGTRSRLVEASLTVLWQLLHTAPGETVGATLRQEISRDREQVKSIMEKIVRDTRGRPAGDKRHQLAEGILEQLHSIPK